MRKGKERKEKRKERKKQKENSSWERKKERKGTKRIRRGRKGKVKERRKEKGKGKERREREKKDFPVLRRSRLDSLSTKVGTRSAIYMWTPKTWSLDKLHKVGVSPTRIPFHLRVVNDCVG